jgi:hypothetical protein
MRGFPTLMDSPCYSEFGDYNICPSTTLVTESNDDICLQLS